MAEVLSNATGRQIRHLPITFEDFYASVAEACGDAIAISISSEPFLTSSACKAADGFKLL